MFEERCAYCHRANVDLEAGMAGGYPLQRCRDADADACADAKRARDEEITADFAKRREELARLEAANPLPVREYDGPDWYQGEPSGVVQDWIEQDEMEMMERTAPTPTFGLGGN